MVKIQMNRWGGSMMTHGDDVVVCEDPAALASAISSRNIQVIDDLETAYINMHELVDALPQNVMFIKALVPNGVVWSKKPSAFSVTVTRTA